MGSVPARPGDPILRKLTSGPARMPRSGTKNSTFLAETPVDLRSRLTFLATDAAQNSIVRPALNPPSSHRQGPLPLPRCPVTLLATAVPRSSIPHRTGAKIGASVVPAGERGQ